MRDLHTLALHCDYTNTTEMVRDRFVMGIGDPLGKQKLQLMAADLSLDKAVTIARQNEQVKTQMGEQLQHTAHVSEARAGGRNVRDRRRAEPQKSQTAQKCDLCGYAQHARDRKCPAASQKCQNCNRRGHFAYVCRSSKQTYHGPTHATSSEVQADGPAGPFLVVVDCTTNNDAWFVTLNVRCNRFRFKIDTGADVTVIS